MSTNMTLRIAAGASKLAANRTTGVPPNRVVAVSGAVSKRRQWARLGVGEDQLVAPRADRVFRGVAAERGGIHVVGDDAACIALRAVRTRELRQRARIRRGERCSSRHTPGSRSSWISTEGMSAISVLRSTK